MADKDIKHEGWVPPANAVHLDLVHRYPGSRIPGRSALNHSVRVPGVSSADIDLQKSL